MLSISRFTLGLGLVMAGMFAVGVGVARAQVSDTKADACLLRLKSATINLQHVAYISIERGRAPSNINFWYGGANNAYLSLGSNDVAADLVAYTARLRACINAK